MNDRIKLAKAMFPDLFVSEKWLSERQADGSRGPNIKRLPDPENDANDDYAVLEWMRNTSDKWSEFESALTLHAGDPFVWCYQIGDYARAALKVLGESDE